MYDINISISAGIMQWCIPILLKTKVLILTKYIMLLTLFIKMCQQILLIIFSMTQRLPLFVLLLRLLWSVTMLKFILTMLQAKWFLNFPFISPELAIISKYLMWWMISLVNKERKIWLIAPYIFIIYISEVYMHYMNVPTRKFVKESAECLSLRLIFFWNLELTGLNNTSRSMNHDISDTTNHEIHTNLPLSLYNIACGHWTTVFWNSYADWQVFDIYKPVQN